MWPTEYMVHERRKELQRVAAQVALEHEATRPQRAGWMAVFSRIALRLRRSRPIEIGELAPRVTRLERAR
jgi:hypothetical protein